MQSAGPWSRVLPSTWWNEDAVVVAKTGIKKGFALTCFSFWTKFTLYTVAHSPEENHNSSQHFTILRDRTEDLWKKQCKNTEIERFWLGGKRCQRWSQKSFPLSYHLWPLLAFLSDLLFVSPSQFPPVTRSALLHIGWRSLSICLSDKEGAACLPPNGTDVYRGGLQRPYPWYWSDSYRWLTSEHLGFNRLYELPKGVEKISDSSNNWCEGTDVTSS